MAQNLELALRIVAKNLAGKDLDAVRAALGQVGKEAAAADAKGGFAQTRAGIKSISEQLDVAKRAFLAFQAIQAGVAAARDITDRADAYASFTARLKLASGSAQQFAAAMSDVQRIAAATQSPIASVAQLYSRLSQSLRAMGADQAKVAEISETVALALRVSGAGAAESGAAMLQLSQAFASGALRGDEFNSVNEAAPRLMKALADSLDVPVGALRQMAEDGKLTADILAENLPKALEQLRKESADIPNTIGGAFQQLSDAMTRYIGQTGEATGLSSGLADAVQTLADHFDLMGDAVIALGFGAALAGLIGLAGGLYGAATAAGAATLSLGGLRAAMLALSATPMGAFLTLAGVLGTIVFSATQVSKSIESASDTAVDKTKEMKAAIQDLETTLDALIKRRIALQKQAAENAKAATKDELEASKKAISEQIAGYERLRDSLVRAFEEAGDKAKSYADKAADLRAKASVPVKDDSIEGQARAMLDLIYAQERLLSMGTATPLGDVERQAELVRKLAGNINDTTRAAEAQKVANEAEARANERAAEASKELQAGLGEQMKANDQRLADFTARLNDIESKLTALANEKTILTIQADEEQLAKLNAEIDVVLAKLAVLRQGATVPISADTNTGGASGKFAAGGLITGPGHDTSDNLLAWLSPGEFVMRAAAVRRWGVERLAAMNRFADGGLVSRAVSSLPGLPATSAAPGFPNLGSLEIRMGDASYPVYAAPDTAESLRRAARKLGSRR